jgi:hypothetical protein
MSTDTRVSFGSMAVLVEAVDENAEVNGVLPVEFLGGEALNVILFSRNSTRVVTPLNATNFRMLSETSSLCVNLQTVRESRSSSEVGRFTVNYTDGPVEKAINVFGFAYEIGAKEGQVVVGNMSSFGLNSRHYLQPRFDESKGGSYIPVILQAQSFSGETTFTVGAVEYQVVGVWDQYGFLTSSGENPAADGGLTIIPHEGFLEGTYDGNVLCEGQVTIRGELHIKGSLNTKQGYCIVDYDNGDITIEGDWLAREVYTDMGAIFNHSLRIYGDWIFANVSLHTGSDSVFIYVLGDLIQDLEAQQQNFNFHIYAEPGTDAPFIAIGGDLIVIGLTSDGGNAAMLTGIAKDASEIWVGGDVNAISLSIKGGDVNEVDEEVEVVVSGNGGYLECRGDIKVENLYLNGGSNLTGTPGNGGSAGQVSCIGDLVVKDDVYGSGGNGADSTIDSTSTSGGASGGNAAIIECTGDIYIKYALMQGGDGLGVGSGGAGGEIYGNRLSGGDWNLEGGNLIYSIGNSTYGKGGKIECSELSLEDLIVSQGSFANETNFENTSAESGAGSGRVEVSGDLIVINLTGLGAHDSGSLNPSFDGGNGAEVIVGGKLKAVSIDLKGGSSYGKNAGSGGYLEVKGGIFVETVVDLTGGESMPIGEEFPALVGGSSGSMDIFGGGNVGTISLLDGIGETAPTSNAGLTLSGMLSVNQIELDYRSNVYIVSATGGLLRVRSMPVKDRLHHILGDDYIESNPVNDYTLGSLFISMGPNQDWFMIESVEIPAAP